MAKTRRTKKEKAGTRARAFRMTRVQRTVAAAQGVSAAADTDPNVPLASIAAAGGPVTVGISFGQAQHGQYTIQLFDPTGATELLRQPGLNTDAIPDQFVLQASPAALDHHILQWSGAVSAFSPAPGQQFSVTFEVSQNGLAVPGGRVQRVGALNVTQAFVGVLRMVTR